MFEIALATAEARGYLQRPEFHYWKERVPSWLAEMWSLGGVERFEQRIGQRLPAALRGFYGIPELVICLQSFHPGDCDLFLAEIECEPFVCRWDGKEFLAIAFHGHSGGLYGVQLRGCDDPPMAAGCADEPEIWGSIADVFSEWVGSAVREAHPRKGT